VWYSVDCQITFHVLDSKSNKQAWTANAKKKIRDPNKGMQDIEKQVDQIYSKILKSFPPRAE
jgi:hypothetical protein